MYSVLLALLAIAAYHSGLKNTDLGTACGIVVGGKGSSMETKPVLLPSQDDECTPFDFECQLRSYENL